MLQLAIAALLVALNGLLALSKLAIVSAQKARLRAMAEAGKAGAGAALALAESPGRFLSTVQIGITLVGILAGTFSGATLGARLAEILQASGLPTAVADVLGYGLVIGGITYFSVVLGEFVPKHAALRDPEAIACRIAPMMVLVSRVGAPLVWLLEASTRRAFQLLGRSAEADGAITEEEIRAILAQAATAGVIEADETRLISGVLRLGDRAARGIMTPRADVDQVDLEDNDADIRLRLATTPHSRLPVVEGNPDNVIGIIKVRDLLKPALHHLPQVGESAETLGWRFEVVDLDGRRIDIVLAAPSTSAIPTPDQISSSSAGTGPGLC